MCVCVGGLFGPAGRWMDKLDIGCAPKILHREERKDFLLHKFEWPLSTYFFSSLE